MPSSIYFTDEQKAQILEAAIKCGFRVSRGRGSQLALFVAMAANKASQAAISPPEDHSDGSKNPQTLADEIMVVIKRHLTKHAKVIMDLQIHCEQCGAILPIEREYPDREKYRATVNPCESCMEEAAQQSMQPTRLRCSLHNEPVSDLIYFACGCSQEPPRR